MIHRWTWGGIADATAVASTTRGAYPWWTCSSAALTATVQAERLRLRVDANNSGVLWGEQFISRGGGTGELRGQFTLASAASVQLNVGFGCDREAGATTFTSVLWNARDSQHYWEPYPITTDTAVAAGNLTSYTFGTSATMFRVRRVGDRCMSKLWVPGAQEPGWLTGGRYSGDIATTNAYLAIKLISTTGAAKTVDFDWLEYDDLAGDLG